MNMKFNSKFSFRCKNLNEKQHLFVFNDCKLMNLGFIIGEFHDFFQKKKCLYCLVVYVSNISAEVYIYVFLNRIVFFTSDQSITTKQMVIFFKMCIYYFNYSNGFFFQNTDN
jgi:hypothetical protein